MWPVQLGDQASQLTRQDVFESVLLAIDWQAATLRWILVLLLVTLRLGLESLAAREAGR